MRFDSLSAQGKAIDTTSQAEFLPIDCVSVCGLDNLPQQNHDTAPQPQIPGQRQLQHTLRLQQTSGPTTI